MINLKKRGVTLIELLAVCVIIGGTMVTIFNSYFRLREASVYCYQKMFSIFLTIDLMERMLITDPRQFEPVGPAVKKDSVIESLTNIMEGPHPQSGGPAARQAYPDFNQFKAVLTSIEGGTLNQNNSGSGELEYEIDAVPDSCVAYIVGLKGLQAKRPPSEMLATFVCYDYTDIVAP